MQACSIQQHVCTQPLPSVTHLCDAFHVMHFCLESDDKTSMTVANLALVIGSSEKYDVQARIVRQHICTMLPALAAFGAYNLTMFDAHCPDCVDKWWTTAEKGTTCYQMFSIAPYFHTHMYFFTHSFWLASLCEMSETCIQYKHSILSCCSCRAL